MKMITIATPLSVSALLGAATAIIHAAFLGYSAPIPAACRSGVPYEVALASSTLIVVPATHFGLLQYDVSPKLPNWPHELGPGTLPPWVPHPLPGESSISRSFGWPLPALSGTEVYASTRLVRTPGYISMRKGTLIPTQLRIGLLPNSILHTLAIFTAWSAAARAIKTIKRRLRAANCPNCGYNIAGLAQQVCPECGTELPQRKIETASPTGRPSDNHAN